MEINAEKTKLMANNTSGIKKQIKVNGQKLETVTSFKYLGSLVPDVGSKPEILSRIAQNDSSIDKVETSLERQEHFSQFQNATDALPSHIHLPVWTLTAQLPRKRRVMEMRCYRRLLRISYKTCYQRGSLCQDP